MNEIERVLVDRDGLSEYDAHVLMLELRARANSGEDAEELLREELDLEPDYVFDLLNY